jgi:membrane-bound metal-dependent hydrolase YbcI (DUF457 family)
MMGRTHAASAVVAALAVAVVADVPGTAVPVMAGVAWMSGWMPDVDHPASRAGRLLPPVSWTVRALSVRTVGIAHRGLSHTALAATGWGVSVGTLSALWLLPVAAAWVGLFGFAGYLSGVLGDVPTKQSLNHLLWPSAVQVRWPYWLRFRTAGPAEQWLFRLFIAGSVFLLPMVSW